MTYGYRRQHRFGNATVLSHQRVIACDCHVHQKMFGDFRNTQEQIKTEVKDRVGGKRIYSTDASLYYRRIRNGFDRDRGNIIVI